VAVGGGVRHRRIAQCRIRSIRWWPLAVLAPAALFALIRGLPPRRAG